MSSKALLSHLQRRRRQAAQRDGDLLIIAGGEPTHLVKRINPAIGTIDYVHQNLFHPKLGWPIANQVFTLKFGQWHPLPREAPKTDQEQADGQQQDGAVDTLGSDFEAESSGVTSCGDSGLSSSSDDDDDSLLLPAHDGARAGLGGGRKAAGGREGRKAANGFVAMAGGGKGEGGAQGAAAGGGEAGGGSNAQLIKHRTGRKERKRSLRRLESLRVAMLEQLERWKGSEPLRRLERAEEELCAALAQAELGRAVAAALGPGDGSGSQEPAGFGGGEGRERRAGGAEGAGVEARVVSVNGGTASGLGGGGGSGGGDGHEDGKVGSVASRGPGACGQSVTAGNGVSGDQGEGPAGAGRCAPVADLEAHVSAARVEYEDASAAVLWLLEDVGKGLSQLSDTSVLCKSHFAISGPALDASDRQPAGEEAGSNGDEGGCDIGALAAAAKAGSGRAKSQLLRALVGAMTAGGQRELHALEGWIMLGVAKVCDMSVTLRRANLQHVAVVLKVQRRRLMRVLVKEVEARAMASAAGPTDDDEASWRQSMMERRKKFTEQMVQAVIWTDMLPSTRTLQLLALSRLHQLSDLDRQRRQHMELLSLQQQCSTAELAVAAARGMAEAAAGTTSRKRGSKGRSKGKGKQPNGSTEAAATGAAEKLKVQVGADAEVAVESPPPEVSPPPPPSTPPQLPLPPPPPSPGLLASNGGGSQAELMGDGEEGDAPPPPPAAAAVPDPADPASVGTALVTTAAAADAVATASNPTAAAASDQAADSAPQPLRPQSSLSSALLDRAHLPMPLVAKGWVALARHSLARDVLRRRREQLQQLSGEDDEVDDDLVLIGDSVVAARSHVVNMAALKEREASARLRQDASRCLMQLVLEARRHDEYRNDMMYELEQMRAQLQQLRHQLQQGGTDEAAHTCDNPNCTECRGDGGISTTPHALYDLTTWSEEDWEDFTEFHAQTDYWGYMPVTAGMTDEELFGPPPGGRRLAAAGAMVAAAAGRPGMAERSAWDQKKEVDLHQRIRRRWPLAVLGHRSLALLLVKQADMFPRTAWQAFPMPPPSLSALLPGMLGSPAALWSGADSFRPRAGCPCCVMLLPLGRAVGNVLEPTGAVCRQVAKLDRSFDKLRTTVLEELKQHKSVSLLCRDEEEAELAVLVMAKVRIDEGSRPMVCWAELEDKARHGSFFGAGPEECCEAIRRYGLRVTLAEAAQLRKGAVELQGPARSLVGRKE